MRTIELYDVVRFRSHVKIQPDRIFDAHITYVEDKGDYYSVSYKPLPNQPYTCAWGCTRIYKNEEDEPPYGTRMIEHLGNKKPVPDRHWYPRPGDRSYDLMC